jgi:hypothetical protein
LKPKVHLCLVVVVADRSLVHRHLLQIREEVVAVAVAVRLMDPKEGVVVVAAAAVEGEDRHHPCSLKEEEVEEGVQAG